MSIFILLENSKSLNSRNGTWHLVVTKDPDSSPNQNIGLHYKKYEERNQPMESAIAIGTEPVSSLIAATRISPELDGGVLLSYDRD